MFSKETYLSRRETLRSKLSGGIVLLPGNVDTPRNYLANTYHFRQDSTFLYYFGISQPGYIGLLDVDSGTDTIFADEVSIDDIVWTGPVPTVKELASEVGVENVSPLDKLGDVVGHAIATGRKVHFLPPYNWASVLKLHEIVGIRTLRVKDYVSEELIRAVVSQRELKTDEEMKEIDDAVDITCRMQTTAMKMCRAGVCEREIAGVIEGIALSYGQGVSFNPIVSINGQTLHNVTYDNILRDGRLLLVDCGAESLGFYAGDQTRTMPVSGKFDSRQKDIYEIVLKTKQNAERMAAPGIEYKDVHLAAMKDLTEGLKAVGLMKGDTDEAVAAGAPAMFMPHGLGHQMGMDVHDMEHIGENYVGYDSSVQRSKQFGLASLRMGKILHPGHVITVEPGIYFIPELCRIWRNEKKCLDFINYVKVEEYFDFGGIRLENDILITESGNRQTGHMHTPITVEEVEAALADR